MKPAIEVRGLRKAFGRQIVLDGLDLQVLPGEVFALLGPNGAGKTTTIRMLMGLVPPTSGSIEILGLPMPKQIGRASCRERV